MKVINVLLVIVIILAMLFYGIPAYMYSNVGGDNTINSLFMLITPLVLGPIFGILLLIKMIAKILGRG
ncbi:MAG: hypothetical protein IK093_05355 [Ruminiclostridium sp.]|nr:hypothetical protein [Ruminiclostridium sp.]